MKNQYSMNEKQVEALAAEYGTASAETQRVGMTYLRVIVAACQAVLGKVKRGRVARDTQIQVLEDVTARYYAAVLRGITTPELAPDSALDQAEQTRRSRERNRRSTFARSSKSTLAAFVNTGGDIRALEVETVTRDPLLAAVRSARGVSVSTHRLERAQAAILRLVAAEAKNDPGGARADLEGTIEVLQNALDGMLPNGNGDRASITQVIAARPAHERMPAPRGRAHA